MQLRPPAPQPAGPPPASQPIPAQDQGSTIPTPVIMAPTTPPAPTPIITKTQMGLNAGLALLQTGGVATAPMLNNVIPGANPIGAGGLEAIAIAAGCNVAAQFFKKHDWFDQDKWIIPLLIIVAAGLAILIYGHDLSRIVVNSAIAIDKAIRDYGLLKPLGVYSSGSPTAKDLAQTVIVGVEAPTP